MPQRCSESRRLSASDTEEERRDTLRLLRCVVECPRKEVVSKQAEIQLD